MTIHGITDPVAVRGARPDGRRSRSTASTRAPPPRRSARDGIYAWDGDFYATGLIERLGKAETGGVLRLGLVHYNTAAEVDRTLEAVARIAGRADGRSMTEPASIRRRLARPFDPAELRRIKRLWVRHSIAEDARDIDGLIATLSPTTASTRSSRPASAGRATPARGPSTPSCSRRSRTTRSRCPRSSSGRRACSRSATLTGTNLGPWAGVAAVRAGRLARGPDPVPVGPRHGTVHRGADLVRPRRLIADAGRERGLTTLS